MVILYFFCWRSYVKAIFGETLDIYFSGGASLSLSSSYADNYSYSSEPYTQEIQPGVSDGTSPRRPGERSNFRRSNNNNPQTRQMNGSSTTRPNKKSSYPPSNNNYESQKIDGTSPKQSNLKSNYNPSNNNSQAQQRGRSSQSQVAGDSSNARRASRSTKSKRRIDEEIAQRDDFQPLEPEQDGFFRMGDWDSRENWRYNRDAFYSGKTQAEAYRENILMDRVESVTMLTKITCAISSGIKNCIKMEIPDIDIIQIMN